MLIFSPLEQYKLLYFKTSRLCFLDLSITFYALIIFLIILFLSFIYFIFLSKTKDSQLISKHFFYNFEYLYGFCFNLIIEILPIKGLKYFNIIFIPFFLILFSNILGLIPYSYTITSQLFLTWVLAFSAICGILYNGFKNHGISFLGIFLPPNTSIFLSFLIIPIEIISYIFRPISLSVRLFANMMAGHALLKVIVSFAWKLIIIGSLLHIFATGLLVSLFFLEFCVACIQAYVFTMLIILYINEIYNLH